MHGNDFAHLYLAGYLAKRGNNFYKAEYLFLAKEKIGIERLNPFVYPPPVALFFIPLTFFSYLFAQKIWFFFNHLFLFLAFVFLKKSDSYSKFFIPIAITLTAFYFPLYRTLTAGQLNLLLLFLLSGCWTFSKKGKEIFSALLLAISVVIKLFPCLLIVFFLLKKKWKLVFYCFLFIFLILTISVFLQGLKSYSSYLTLLKEMDYGKSTWASYGQAYHVEPANQSFHALIFRLFTINPVTVPLLNLSHFTKKISILFSACILTTSIGLILKKFKSYPEINVTPYYFSKNKNTIPFVEFLEFSLFLLTALLVPSLLWDHYLVYCLFIFVPLFYMLLSQLFTKSVKKQQTLLSELILHLLILFVIYLLIAIPYNFWDQRFRTGYFIFLISIKLYPTITLWIYLSYLIKKSKSAL